MKNNQHYAAVIGGLLLLAMAMGISRFAYTPILPLMKEATMLSAAALGYLASSNYVGYLIGALCAGYVRHSKMKILRVSVLFNILSTASMAFTDSFFVFLCWRWLAGTTSGLIFVLTSSIVLDYLARNSSKLAGYLYSGVGIGIVLSGMAVPLFNSFSTWKTAWFGLSMLSLLIAVIVSALWKRVEWNSATDTVHSNQISSGQKSFLPWLIVIYGLEGFGYIITATFLVDIAYEIPQWQAYASYFWILAGMAAIPSTQLWQNAMRKWKPLPTLCAAFLLQAIGIMLPLFHQHLISGILSAVLFGITFMGITTICTSYARQLAPENSVAIIGKLTAVYAFGQIIGPAVAGNLAAQTGQYNSALQLAGGALLFAILLSLIGYFKIRKENLHAIREY